MTANLPHMSSLAAKDCIPCRGGVPPLRPDEAQRLLDELGGDWTILHAAGDTLDGSGLHLERRYRFKNFREALDFVIAVGAVAEQQAHHPDISLSWGNVGLEIWTHKIAGLTESDFVLAAKCDAVLSS